MATEFVEPWNQETERAVSQSPSERTARRRVAIKSRMATPDCSRTAILNNKTESTATSSSSCTSYSEARSKAFAFWNSCLENRNQSTTLRTETQRNGSSTQIRHEFRNSHLIN